MVDRVETASDGGSPPLRAGAVGSDDLTRLVYDELRSLASAFMRTQRPGHTLQPTALISEAYLKIVQSSPEALRSRPHFLAVAAKAMRHVLINHAEAKNTAKRGGGATRVPLDFEFASADLAVNHVEVLAVHEALARLEAMDERRAHVVEAKVFAGLTNEEIAEVLGVSTTTVESDWRTARAWLSKELARSGGAP